jgi:hypothetical protein
VKARTLKVLLGVLGALVAAWTIMMLMPRNNAQRGVASAAFAAFQHAAQDTSVVLVRLTGPRNTVTLERSGSSWSANGHRADPGAVARLLKALREVRAGEIVARNPSNHRRLGVADDSTWRVDLYDGTTVRSLLVGKEGPRTGTSYTRPPGNDTVHIVESDLAIRVPFVTDDWRDRRVITVDTATVARVSVDIDGQRYAIVRRDGAWSFLDGSNVDTAGVRIMLSELTQLRAVGFLTATDSIAAKPYSGNVVALNEAGDTLGMLTLSGGPGDRWVRARGDSVMYRIGYYRVERLAPARRLLTRY